MTRYYRRKIRSGVALIELLGAVFIFVVGMAAVFGVFAKGSAQVRDLYRRSLAATLAQSQIELLRTKPFEELRLCRREEVPLDFAAADRLPSVRCLLSVAQAGDDTPGLKEVVVEVCWGERAGEGKVALTTLLCRQRQPLRGQTSSP